jgi:flagellar FliL protein
MAKEDLDLDVEATPEKKAGGMKMIIIAVVGVLLLTGATLGALYFAGIIGGGDKPVPVAEGAPAEGQDGEAAKPDDKAVAGVAAGPMNYLPMEPAFVVNFGADADVRFMQINIQVGSRDSAALESVKTHTPAIRNGLVMLYSSQDPVVLNTRAGKEELLKQTLEEINRVLKEQTGSANVEKVYFTSFVMQ